MADGSRQHNRGAGMDQQVTDGVARVRQRIAAGGGDPSVVRLVAVTKGFGPPAVQAAMAAGVFDVAESYAQELVSKAGALAAGAGSASPHWHFVGRLQSNKVKAVASLVELWQSVDRLRLAEEIAARVPGARVLVQVNLSDDPARGGCAPAEAPKLVEHLSERGCNVAGLMAVGAVGPPAQVRAGFRMLAGLGDDLGLAELSMGMSDDLEIAVEEGSTMVRVGQALFGRRPPPGRWTWPV